MIRLRPHRSLSIALIASIALLALALAACKPAAEPSGEAAAPAATTEPVAGPPHVYFVDPVDGAIIPTLYKFRFAAENIKISPVVEGQNPAGEGHFHIGVDTTCLAAGEVIPKADPWIHFGDGSSEIDVQLAPGSHTIALQLGDGEHRTLADEGLCQVITVTVEEPAAAPAS